MRHWALFIPYPDRNSTTQGIILQTTDAGPPDITQAPQVFEDRMVNNLRDSRHFHRLEYLSALSFQDITELRQLAAELTPPDPREVVLTHFGRMEQDSCQNWVVSVLKAAEAVGCIEECSTTLFSLQRF